MSGIVSVLTSSVHYLSNVPLNQRAGQAREAIRGLPLLICWEMPSFAGTDIVYGRKAKEVVCVGGSGTGMPGGVGVSSTFDIRIRGQPGGNRMVRKLSIILVIGLLAFTAACSSHSSTSVNNAPASANGVAASASPGACPTSNTKSFAKTRFVADIALAGGAFKRYIYSPAKAGKFKK